MWKSLVCVTLLIITDVVVCKPDYLFDQNVNGWLKLHVVPATWQQAFLNCHYEGAVLASPINAKLATALRNIMRQSELDSPIFLGVHAMVSQGDFMSIEGVPLADLSITWGTYVADKTPEECLSLSTDGKTYISSCTVWRPYICYKKRDNTTNLNQCGTFDNDYHYYDATGSCYKYHKKPSTWRRAHKICAAEGGHLVIINDNKEADIVTGWLDKPENGSPEEAAHIGIRDWNRENTFLTLHGEKLENVYNTWEEGQPDNKGVNLCGSIYPNGILDDINCNLEKKFICEKDPNTSRFENIFGEVYETASGASCLLKNVVESAKPDDIPSEDKQK